MGREWSWSRSLRRGEREKEAPPAGCMSSVFQLFDLHQILFKTTAAATAHGGGEGDPLPQDRQVTSPRGVVAPRNSLEQDEAAASPASAITGDQEYGIHGGPRLVTETKTPSTVRAQEIEEGRGSQGTKAAKGGNVVARLMGLDQMLDGQEAPRTSAGYYSRELESPPLVRSHQQRKMHRRGASMRDTAVTPPPRRPLQPRINCNVLAVEDGGHGTRSLPDTPRISSARRSWDTDPRLSLQLSYKENAPPTAAKDLRCLCDAPPGGHSAVSLSPLFAKSKRRYFGQQLDGNRSPSSYADEIIKLVKENVARRIAGRNCDEPLKCETPKGSDKKCITAEELKPGRSPKGITSHSPRPRIPDSPKNKYYSVLINEDSRNDGSSPRLLTAPTPPPLPPPLPVRPSAPFLSAGDREVFVKLAIRPQASAPGKNTKANSERFMEKIRKPPAAASQEESFVSPPLSPQPRRKSRPSLPAFVPGIRREGPTSPVPQTEQQIQVPAPPALRQISDQLLKCGEGDSRERSSAGASAGPEQFQYVRCILERTGVHSHTPLPFATARWYSPSHPVDPILFHQLERSFNNSSGPLRHRCNRKLLFHLVDEVLADLLWPVLHANTWPRGRGSTRRQTQPQRLRIPDGEALMQRLWSQIRSYPSADCRVVQDIDALVEADLPATNVRRLLLHPAVADEGGSLASQLAAEILESLVGDAAAALLMAPWGRDPSVPTEAERRVTTT